MFKEHIFPFQNTHEKYSFSTPLTPDVEDDDITYTFHDSSDISHSSEHNNSNDSHIS